MPHHWYSEIHEFIQCIILAPPRYWESEIHYTSAVAGESEALRDQWVSLKSHSSLEAQLDLEPGLSSSVVASVRYYVTLPASPCHPAARLIQRPGSHPVWGQPDPFFRECKEWLLPSPPNWTYPGPSLKLSVKHRGCKTWFKFDSFEQSFHSYVNWVGLGRDINWNSWFNN